MSETKTINKFLAKVYAWMILAMLITAASSVWVLILIAANQDLAKLLFNSYMFFIILEIWLVFAISFLISRISTFVAILFFLLYSFVNWVTLSMIFFVYDPFSIAIAFLVTSAVFLFMSLYWARTSADLTSFWRLLIVWLFWIIFATIVNFFFNSSWFSYLLSWASVVIFTWLIAYETQMLKTLWNQSILTPEEKNKYAIIWALNLYLDFINLFLNLLRLLWWRD